MHRINFGALKKSVAGAVTSAAHGARDLASDAKEALERALVAKCLRPYVVKHQIGTSGPNGLWKIHTADYRSPGIRHEQTNTIATVTIYCLGGIYPCVSVWILDKKFLQESSNKGKSRAWEPFLDQQRSGAAHLLRLKHPGVLKIIEPLEETRANFVMVTEPILCSLSDWLTYFSAVPDIPESIRDVSFSELEIKHGLLQVSSAIAFLHNDGNRAHCSISPESVLICADGHWAISNLSLMTGIDFTGSTTITSFDYTNPHPSAEEAATKPRLQYVAPELATSHADDPSVSVTPAVDVFSFALVIYAAITRRELLASVEQDFGRYKTKLASIAQIDLTALPANLQPFERMMLSASPSARPPISALSGCAYFQDDLLLRALQFLEGMVGKDPMQKASFLKDLDKFWMQFDVRILRHKVLPPLLQELQNPNLQSLVIPFVFKAAISQDKEEFETYTLPPLKSVMQSIKGEGLLTVLNHCDSLTKVMTRAMVADVLLPIFLRAFDQDAPRIQEEALKKASTIFECLDYQSLKSKVLPRIHVLSMKTVSAKVRINCLVLMGQLIHRLDKDEAQKMMHTCHQITNVDKSPGTLMCVLGVGDSISKYWGEEVTAQQVLPFLSPLLISKNLSHQQFNTYLTVIRDMIQRIEEKVGKQIKESEPVNLKQQKIPQESTWDTDKPKVPYLFNGLLTSGFKDALGDETIGLESWKDFVTPNVTTMSTAVGQQPIASLVQNAAPVDMTPLTSTSANRPAMANDPFDFSLMNGSLNSSFKTSTPPPIVHPPTQTPPMLDPMEFGMNSQPNHSQMLPANVPNLDFFSEPVTRPSVTSQPATVPSTDPFLSLLSPPQTTAKSKDPLADLLG